MAARSGYYGTAAYVTNSGPAGHYPYKQAVPGPKPAPPLGPQHQPLGPQHHPGPPEVLVDQEQHPVDHECLSPRWMTTWRGGGGSSSTPMSIGSQFGIANLGMNMSAGTGLISDPEL
eukprot:g17573.t1